MVTDNFIGERLAAFRNSRGIKQSDLSKAMGFKDRQTLSAIETGERKMQPAELLSAIEFLHITMDEFLDPISVIGKAQFSWRQYDASEAELDETEKYVSKIIALFEHLIKDKEEKLVILPKLPLNKQSTVSDAEYYAKQLAAHLNLGEYPAQKIQSIVSEQLGIKTFYLDLNPKVSSAAVNMTSKNYIVINRNDVLGSRNFNYAHELFHSLTWDALTPLKVKKAYLNDKGKKPIVEKLADAFVTSILMPQDTIRAHMNLNSNDVDEDYVNALADKFLVNSPAMLVRLKTLGLITQAQFDGMDRNKLKEGRGLSKTTQPLSFNFEFASALNEAISEGKISVRKAAEDLNISINSLKEVFVSHNLPQVFDL